MYSERKNSEGKLRCIWLVLIPQKSVTGYWNPIFSYEEDGSWNIHVTQMRDTRNVYKLLLKKISNKRASCEITIPHAKHFFCLTDNWN
jgi:hypothetical protein